MYFYESRLSRDLKTYKNSIILHKNTWKNIPKDDIEPIREYTNDSESLNNKLIKGEKLDDKEQKTHDAILKNSKPLYHEVHLYSGTSHDFGKMARASKNGIIVSPAHLSTTHRLITAMHFTRRKNEGDAHIIHIHAKPEDKGLHVSITNKTSGEPDREHETILPAGTKLKYSHSTVHKYKHQPFKIHHFTIDSQD
jgi:hypothetical protein